MTGKKDSSVTKIIPLATTVGPLEPGDLTIVILIKRRAHMALVTGPSSGFLSLSQKCIQHTHMNIMCSEVEIEKLQLVMVNLG